MDALKDELKIDQHCGPIKLWHSLKSVQFTSWCFSCILVVMVSCASTISKNRSTRYVATSARVAMLK